MAASRSTFTVRAFEAKTLSWWRVRKPQIDMSPPYQRRGRLWSAADKAYLIDSILNGFDVPKFYIAEFTYSDSKLNKKKLPFAIIDGKQRFEAIFDFFEGQLTLNSDFVFLDDPSLKLGGLGYKDITQNYKEVAEIFDNYNISVMSVITNKVERINELFVRLNRSKPLTGAEVRNAMTGPAPEVIRELAKHEFFIELIKFQVQRGQDQNAAVKLLLFEYHNEPQETKKTILDNFVKEAGKARDKLELAARRTRASLDDLASIFLPKDPLLSSAGLVPVYYWFIRDLKARDYPRVRDFLVRFEEDRKRNRQKVDEGASGRIDREFVEYDQFNRNTNDVASHVGRIRILKNKFSRFTP